MRGFTVKLLIISNGYHLFLACDVLIRVIHQQTLQSHLSISEYVHINSTLLHLSKMIISQMSANECTSIMSPTGVGRILLCSSMVQWRQSTNCWSLWHCTGFNPPPLDS